MPTADEGEETPETGENSGPHDAIVSVSDGLARQGSPDRHTQKHKVIHHLVDGYRPTRVWFSREEEAFSS